jgi:hypothetical protein
VGWTRFCLGIVPSSVDPSPRLWCTRIRWNWRDPAFRLRRSTNPRGHTETGFGGRRQRAHLGRTGRGSCQGKRYPTTRSPDRKLAGSSASRTIAQCPRPQHHHRETRPSDHSNPGRVWFTTLRGSRPRFPAPSTSRGPLGDCRPHREAWTYPLGPDAPTRQRMSAAGIRTGRVFRPINKGGRLTHESLTEKCFWSMLRKYAAGIGLPNLAPHDLRRSCAKLARQGGASLEQIQLSLGHASVQTHRDILGQQARPQRRSL